MAHERQHLTPQTLGRLAHRWPFATGRQLDRFAVLAQEWRELKSELDDAHREHHTPIDILEPVLQSPRSCLNPEYLDAERAGDDGVSPHGELQ
jgi:hypothetical protein